MNSRDTAILEDLRTFHCMSRDQIIGMHFNHLKNPINSCNSVLKRLVRDGHIKCSTRFTPYVYFPSTSKIKPDSQKIPHYLDLVSTVIEMMSFKKPKHLIVEPRYGSKGVIEPDIFAVWQGVPIFIEVQRNQYTKEVMQKKINLYEAYFNSNDWMNEAYQKEGKERFPTVLIITPSRYGISTTNVRVYQAPSVSDFMDRINSQQNKVQPEAKRIKSSGNGIKFNVG